MKKKTTRSNTSQEEVEHVSPEACGRMIGLAGSTVRRHIHMGIIPFIRVPRANGVTIRNSFKVPMSWITEVKANRVDFEATNV